MPVKTKKRGKKYRLIESDTGRIAKNAAGTAIDGGGHSSKAKSDRQAAAVNSNIARKRGKP